MYTHVYMGVHIKLSSLHWCHAPVAGLHTNCQLHHKWEHFLFSLAFLQRLRNLRQLLETGKYSWRANTNARAHAQTSVTQRATALVGLSLII